ncbi:MAG TPA: DUF6766 family protein [Solirubrobacteraceae bacterium]|nr:DUF6766 family protein [Solirubrobacteraceae bacterium]
MSRFVRESSLTLAFLTIFLAALVGQAFVGHSDFNHDQIAHQDETVSLWRFVTSSAYWVDVMENWQSEYLQFTLFILGTVWLVQRGSPESKELDKVGRESDEDQLVGEHARDDSPKWAKVNGWRRTVYENSLLLLMGSLMLATWFAQLVTGRVEYNSEQLDHHEAALSLWQYAGSSDFWNRTLQNWQSEFLAVASMAVFAIWLRQRGSPESKPVGASHDATGVEG